jgi:hypothetical protein
MPTLSSALGSWPEDKVGISVKRDVSVFAVDFGRGSREDQFAFFASSFQDPLGAVDIRLDGSNGAFHDQFDTDRCGKMHDDVGIVDEFRKQLEIVDRVQVIFHLAGSLQMADVVYASSGEIVEQDDTVATGEKPLRQVRTDKTSAARNQITQCTSLQGLVVVAIAK